MRDRIVENPIGQDWLDQIFRSRAAQSGGVVRRRLADVEREIGVATLGLEVRRRGFHMIECSDQLVIACCPKPVKIIC